MTRRSGFTLIELLIVVAIIAILAAIAVPNFLEAQTRSRVSRALNDLRSVSLAMEMYRLDNGTYAARGNDHVLPDGSRDEVDKRLLTTPISYISAVPDDVFRKVAGMDADDQSGGTPTYRIYAVAYTPSTTVPEGYRRSLSLFPKTAWMTWSIGPDTLTNTDGYRPLGRVLLNESTMPMGIGIDKNKQWIGASGSYFGLRYDPTNGTVSYGDVYRFDGDSMNRLN